MKIEEAMAILKDRIVILEWESKHFYWPENREKAVREIHAIQMALQMLGASKANAAKFQ